MVSNLRCGIGFGVLGLARTDCSLVTGDELHTDTAVVVVGRVALALVGARMTPHDACLDRRAG